MDTNLIQISRELNFKFKLLAHFQKCYLRRDDDKAMREHMIFQTRKVVKEVKEMVEKDSTLKLVAAHLVKEFDVNLILIVAKEAK